MATFYNGRESIEVTSSTDFHTQPRNVLLSVSPAHCALEKLDREEKEATRQYQARIIKLDKYNVTCDMIQLKRDKAIIALDKEMGVYVSPAEIAKLRKQANKDAQLAYLIGETLKAERNKALKDGAKIGLHIVAFILACTFPAISLLYVGAILWYCFKR